MKALTRRTVPLYRKHTHSHNAPTALGMSEMSALHAQISSHSSLHRRTLPMGVGECMLPSLLLLAMAVVAVSMFSPSALALPCDAATAPHSAPALSAFWHNCQVIVFWIADGCLRERALTLHVRELKGEQLPALPGWLAGWQLACSCTAAAAEHYAAELCSLMLWRFGAHVLLALAHEMYAVPFEFIKPGETESCSPHTLTPHIEPTHTNLHTELSMLFVQLLLLQLLLMVLPQYAAPTPSPVHDAAAALFNCSISRCVCVCSYKCVRLWVCVCCVICINKIYLTIKFNVA